MVRLGPGRGLSMQDMIMTIFYVQVCDFCLLSTPTLHVYQSTTPMTIFFGIACQAIFVAHNFNRIL